MRALMAEFGSPEALVLGVKTLKAAGFVDLDAFTPYPLKEIEPLLALRRSPIPVWVLLAGLAGAAGAYLLQWWCAAVAYPLAVGGRPLHSAPSFVPIAFESAILAAALAAVASVVFYARLLRLYDVVALAPGFERASVDRFWVAAYLDEGHPSGLDEAHGGLRAALVAHGATQVVVVAGPA